MKSFCMVTILLLLSGCTEPISPIATTHDGFITQEGQDAFDKARAKIGKHYWAEILQIELCDSIDNDPVVCPSPKGKLLAFYGPFLIKDVIRSSGPSSNFYFLIETPDGQTKYLKTYFQDNFVSQDPKIRQAKAKAECDRRGGVSIGMTAQQVLASCWGKPSSRNITRVSNDTHEQWVYDGGYVYLDNGVVTATQTSR